jgi:type III pantothenate kinase
MMPHTLAIDVGNTTTHLGLFAGEQLVCSFRLASTHTRTFDEAALLFKQVFADAGIKPDTITGSVVGSVVPMMTPLIEEAVTRLCGRRPIMVSHHSKLTIRLDVPRPEQIGADRIANAEGFWVEHGQAGIVVDFGTATTFDVISTDGAYIGGSIAPGIETSGNLLAQKAAQLFKVSIAEPPSVIGTTTEEALRSGLFFGAIGSVDEIVRRIMAQLGGKPKVIATGGLAETIAAGSMAIESVDPVLTLKGLRHILRNSMG